MLVRFFAALCSAVVWVCTSASADSASQWRALTLTDIVAAHDLLAEDHPAASRTLNDAEFRAALEAAYRRARRRAREVSNYDGYVATMAEMANAMGDRHIWSRPLYRSDNAQWAGLIVAKRGDAYVIVADENGEDSAHALVAATLVSCDGVEAEDFARDKLGGFRGVWSIEAQRIQAAPWLLIDDGNPFVLRPNACIFERDGARHEVPLRWRSIANVEPRVRQATNIGAAGYGVRDFAGGVWIGLQGLGDAATGVVEAVQRDADRLRAARMVVLDLRGNGGGNSAYGRQIAESLYGEARIESALGGGEGECDSVWRASARNIAQLRSYLVQFAQLPEFVAELRRQLTAVEEARARGRDLSGDPACGGHAAAEPRGAPPPLPARGRIVVLTDSVCFSSCLIVADDFRRLGALHVGHATNANTHFSEVREERMPSGLSMFSTLQAMMPAAPRSMGPFEPAVRYEGDMGDTTALEAWVAGLAGR